MIKLYFDGDGVLADFEAQYSKLTGLPWKSCNEKSERELMWSRIIPYEDFFLNLPRIQKGFDLWKVCSGFSTPEILTAASGHFPKSGMHKRIWFKRELDVFGPRVHVVDSPSEKSLYYSTPESILIDDREQTINEWDYAGGKGILFNSDKSLEDLQNEVVRSILNIYSNNQQYKR